MSDSEPTAPPDPERPQEPGTATWIPGSPAGAVASDATSESEPQVPADLRFLRRVGRGGMGEVWEAEQLSPVQRRVAVKVLRDDQIDRATLQRFRLERQLLALMDHPSIAQIYDAGETEGGRPYLIMEFVDGEPLTRFCERAALTLEQRLQLFRQVCEAVHHAHQKTVLHRDLKPSNILVTQRDGLPLPKVIDFGVAKATAAISDGTDSTLFGQVVGTPGYMSPEQADPNRPVDVRSDVYSLGCILYELLTGARPGGAAASGSRGRSEATPSASPIVKPSALVRRNPGPGPSTEPASRPSTHSTHSTVSQRSLRGDLDWITLKALATEPARRYASASELSADIHRYLTNEPVSAGPPGLTYRLGKLTRRYRWQMIGSAVAAALLLISSGVAVVQSLRAREAEAEAQQGRLSAESARAEAEGVTRFLVDTFRMVSPTDRPPAEVSLLDFVERASERLDEMQAPPDTRARLHHSLGEVQVALGLFDEASDHFDRSIELRQASDSESDLQRALTRTHLARAVMYSAERAGEAPALARQAEEVLRPLRDEYPRSWVEARATVAVPFLDQNRWDEVTEWHQPTVEFIDRLLGPESYEWALVHSQLAFTHTARQDHAGAAELWARVAAIHDRDMPPLAYQRVTAHLRLAEAIRLGGDHATACEKARSLVDQVTSAVSLNHALAAPLVLEYSMCGKNTGTSEEVLPFALAVYDAMEADPNGREIEMVFLVSSVTMTLNDTGQPERAEEIARQWLPFVIEHMGAESFETLELQYHLREALELQGRQAEADALPRVH